MKFAALLTLGLLAAAPAMAQPAVKAFPRHKHPSSEIELSVLKTGELMLRDGCLRLKGDRGDPVAVWPNEAVLDLSKGDVRILNRATGESVSPGGTIILGGNSTAVEPADVIDQDPACPGPYMLVSNPRPYGPFAAEMWERRVREYARSWNVPLAEARRRLEAHAAREEELKAFAERLAAERPDLFGEITTHEGKATLKLAGEAPPGLIPPDLAADITVEPVPRPLAELDAVRHALLDRIEAAGLEATAWSDIDAGRIVLQAEDLQALSRAAVEGRLDFPQTVPVQVITSGGKPAGYFSEWNMEAAWQALESAPDFAEIQALVAASDLPFYGQAPRKPSANGAKEIARYLVMLGFTAEKIRALRVQGVDPVTAWVQQNGFSTPESRAVLAEQVVAAEVLSVDPNGRALNDGHRTTVRFRVTETLKGAADPGDVLTVRLVSGFDPDGSYQQENGEPVLLPALPGALAPGDRYLLHLSSGQYANTARHSGYKPANPTWHALRHEMTPATEAEIANLRDRLAPIQAAFEAADAH